jgi:hypothetical protein
MVNRREGITKEKSEACINGLRKTLPHRKQYSSREK